MSSNPNFFRLPTNLSGKAEPEVVEAIGWHDDAINDLQQAIPALVKQINAIKPSTTTTTTAAQAAASGTTIIVPGGNIIGTVNSQIGNTAYTTQSSDYGAIIVFTGSSAIAVTLAVGPVIQTPFFCVISNQSTANLTVTPASGTINGASNLVLPGMSWCAAYFDGTNFWAVGAS